jgi:hypothetical protein
VTADVVRFYIDDDSGYLPDGTAFADIDPARADEYEQDLKQKQIFYVRIDL